MLQPTLYIFSGLPGVGKTTLATALSNYLSATYLRIDTIEQTLIHACGREKVEVDGYYVAYQIARDNLSLGHNVVADSVNPIGITRQAWHNIAKGCDAKYVDIEVVCTDKLIHRERIENRTPDLNGHVLPNWQDVIGRNYEPWGVDSNRITIDTAVGSEAESINSLISTIPDSHA